MKAYIVTQGSYSDYGIRAVFIDEDKANQFAKIDNSEVEEWDIFDNVPERIHIFHINDYTQTIKANPEQRWPQRDNPIIRRNELIWKHEQKNYYDTNNKPAKHQWEGKVSHTFGTDEKAVEKLHKEVHAAWEAEKADI